MKRILYLILFANTLSLAAQEIEVIGVVKDSASLAPMIGVHVQNINQGLLTYTNPEGAFKMHSSVGDTLVLSSVGHQTLYWILVEGDGLQEKEFLLPVNTIYLEEVVVGKLPTYIRFKDKVMNTSGEDTSYVVPGIPRVAITKRSRLNGSLSIQGPFSTLHNLLSKEAKEKKKVKKFLAQKPIRARAESKFTRAWVSKNTQLIGDELTHFIAYCNFSDEYLAATPAYEIYERMMALLPDFLAEQEGQS